MINNDVRYVDRNGDGATTVFSFNPLVVFAATDLKVYLIDEADDTDNGTLIPQGTGSTDYSVSVAAFPGTGSITYPASGGSPLATGKRLRLIADVPLLQDAQFEHQGGMTPKVIERLFDKVVVRLQTVYELMDRALRVPRSSASTPETYLDDITTIATAEATAQAAAAAGSASAASTSAGSAATSASAASASASAAAASAVTAAAAADNLKATSATSLAIGTGTKTFVAQSGKAFQDGGWVVAASNANEANFMFGQITSYVGTSLEVNVTSVGGSGTFADWNIAISGIQGAQGPAGSPGAGTGDVVGPASAVANRIATFNGTTGKLIQDSGQLITTAMSTLAGLTPAADRIPIFTGAASAALQTVTADTKALLAAANYAAVLSQLGLVRPADGQVWYSDAGVLSSSVDLSYNVGAKQLTAHVLEVDSNTNLLLPGATRVKLGALADNRPWPAMRTPDYAAVRLQPLLGSLWHTWWAYPSVISFTSVGGASAGTFDAGTVIKPTAGGTWRTRNAHVRLRSSAVAGNVATVHSDGAAQRAYRSATVGLGGFHTEMIFALDTDATGFQFFAGLAGTGLNIVGDPSALVDCFGVGFDAADASGGNFFLMHNDASGTATRVDTGMPRGTTATYRLVLDCPVGNATTLYWRLINLHSGTTVSGTVTTNLPTDGNPLTTHLNYRNGAVASIAGVLMYQMLTNSPMN